VTSSLALASASRPTPLVPALRGLGVAGKVGLVVAGTALLALSAHAQIPFWPVKLSLQTFVVLALALAYGGRMAAATVLAYLAEGAMGLPVFQGGAGLAYMAGPTGGYLAGFVLAAFVVGTLADRGGLATLPRSAGLLALGVALIYLPGLAWLSVLFGAEKAISFGLLPFLPAEALKLALLLALTALYRAHRTS